MLPQCVSLMSPSITTTTLASSDPVLMSLKEGYKKSSKLVFKAPIKEKKSVVVNGIDLLENVPPRTENEVRSSSYGPCESWESQALTCQLPQASSLHRFITCWQPTHPTTKLPSHGLQSVLGE